MCPLVRIRTQRSPENHQDACSDTVLRHLGRTTLNEEQFSAVFNHIFIFYLEVKKGFSLRLGSNKKVLTGAYNRAV